MRLYAKQKGALRATLARTRHNLPHGTGCQLYRCLLLGTRAALGAVQRIRAILGRRPIRNLSTQILYVSLSKRRLTTTSKRGRLFPRRLLRIIGRTTPRTPRLCRDQGTLLTPMLVLASNTVRGTRRVLLLARAKGAQLAPTRDRVTRLLLNRDKRRAFPLNDKRIAFQHYIMSIRTMRSNFTIALANRHETNATLPATTRYTTLTRVYIQAIRHY